MIIYLVKTIITTRNALALVRYVYGDLNNVYNAFSLVCDINRLVVDKYQVSVLERKIAEQNNCIKNLQVELLILNNHVTKDDEGENGTDYDWEIY